MSENHRQYSTPVCRGSFALGTACKICDRCKDNLPSYLDQLAKENERLTKERDEFLRDATTCGQSAMRHKDERDQAHAYNAQQDLVIDTLRTKHAAMQEAIVEAVRRAEGYGVGEGSLAGFITATLRPHLPTPEPAPVDPLVDVVSELVEQGGFDSLPGYVDKLRAALPARGLEVRKIGEGAARQFRSSDNG